MDLKNWFIDEYSIGDLQFDQIDKQDEYKNSGFYGNYFVCSNGEIVEPRSGLVIAIDSLIFSRHPSMSESAKMMLAYYDGVSPEAIGMTPRYLILSKGDRRLLSRLRPFQHMKQEVRRNYDKFIDRLNHDKRSEMVSNTNKARWADPTDTFNTKEYLLFKNQRIKEAWTPEKKAWWSKRMKERYANPRKKARHLQGVRRYSTWKKLDGYFKGLFMYPGGIQ